MYTTSDLHQILQEHEIAFEHTNIMQMFKQISPRQREVFGSIFTSYPEYAADFVQLFAQKQAAIKDKDESKIESILKKETDLLALVNENLTTQ